MGNINKIILKEGQVWRSKDNPERDFKISYITDPDPEIVCWVVANDNAWSKWVSEKKNIDSLDEFIKNGGSTFTYSYAGERSIVSTKRYIRKHDMTLECCNSNK